MSQTSFSHRRQWYHPLAFYRSVMIRPRVLGGLLASAVALVVMPESLSIAVRSTIAWDVGGIVYLAMACWVMIRCNVDHMRQRAARQDDSGIIILLLILLAIAGSFGSIAGLINEAKTAEGEAKLLFLGLATLTILVSWMVTQVAFTMHYAHEHYAPHNTKHSAGGLIFPEDDHPDYGDFLYFATSIGATSQTSDVEIRTKAMRRLVTVHSIAAFFFNTMVLALTINLAASLV